MCGIAGFAGRGSKEDVAKMIGSIRHRGPNDQGVYHDPETNIHLGHRRLSILDLSGGHQPMTNAAGDIWVVYNGEVYNHLELRTELEAKGHVFQSSHSDTEVLIHGYKAWGTDLPKHLNGMFAFAIYDKAHKCLFLARDRFGEKPLYYFQRGGTFGFASETSAICQHRSFSADIRMLSVQKFFAHGFFPAPNTLYENCWKLPGGSSLIYDLIHDKIRIEEYWKFSLTPDHGLTDQDEERLCDELTSLISDAVKRRLVADVPVGLFLSGGVDSSAILANAAIHREPGTIKSFNIGFSDPTFDESTWAQRMAEFSGSSHYSQVLNMDTAMSLIPELLDKLDEPLGDPSILPTYLLSKFTRQHVTVALSGDGGDELFAGYDPFKALQPAILYERLVPDFIHKILRNACSMLPISGRNMSLDYKLRNALKGLSHSQALWNPIWLSPLDPKNIHDLFLQPIALDDLYSEVLERWYANPDLDIVDRTLEFYSCFYLPDGILTKTDRATMLTSLESRAVFLDNGIVDFCLRLPNRFKFRNGTTKYLLKKSLSRLLPEDILARQKKGFGIPLAEWLRHIQPPTKTSDEIGLNTNWLQQRWNSHHTGKEDHRLLLWAQMSLHFAVAHANDSSATEPQSAI